MARITKPEKWKDTFFLKLTPTEKLIFIYLYENCDDAGFLDINFPKIALETGISQEDIGSAFKRLEKTFLVSENCEKLWLKKFLIHQNKLPLDLKSESGVFIKYHIEYNLPSFNYCQELRDILSNTKKGRAKSQSAFEVPDLQQVIDNFKQGEWSFITKDEIVSIYDYYVSVNWKVGSKKMADWNKAFIGCFRRNLNRRTRQVPYNQKPTRMEVMIEENKKIEHFDFNTLTK